MEVLNSNIRRGVLPLLTYALLTAAMDVYAGNRFEMASPASIAAISFTLTMIFFLTVELWRQRTRHAGMLRVHRQDLVAINITTAVTWLSTLYALDRLEPAIVNVIGLALGPVVAVLVGPLLRRQSKAIATEVVVSVAICALVGALVWASFTGRSGLVGVTSRDAVLGLLFALVCA
ncbi:MAG: EamA family transporter, partial [Actinobacteria bacterium]|nr:EamA family transporter [Actinomycetota bacterium]